MSSSDRPLALVNLPRKVGAADAAARWCDIAMWDEIADKDRFLAERGFSVRAVVTASTLAFPASLESFPNLELLAFFGAGFATAETQACEQRGIAVSNVPATNHLDVADLAVGLAIAVIRGIGASDRLVRAGGWDRLLPVPLAPSLRDLRYGIVGFGAIGAAIAQRLEAFGGSVRWWGPRPKSGVRWGRADSLIDLARDVDVLIVAVRADDTTRHLIDAAVLAALGAGGYVVNVSRGFVIDEDALVAALANGRLAGAGLDVFADEPTDAGRWSDFGNVVLSPHVGGWAQGSIRGAQEVLAENLRRRFAGEPLLTPVSA